ncbi:chromo domain-containing protein LHP1-like [Hibiscus syriacus]|uniref:Chromo domain-containing protein LHP1-like n=1 Tax=Hibiscus syriacus TaxID=106335 RepID=A0A6A2XGD4_HIBSY|nr:chromo domain-containing protein LHP1-like [Hibiscus syriacus]
MISGLPETGKPPGGTCRAMWTTTNFTQWAAAAGVDRRTLRQRLNYGTLCKDKMVKSNIRLVISIAKNYQGAGMNLQDLVQEGCRGLTSKGFKFSTYAHWWIKQAFHMVEATYRVKEARKQLYSENGRQPNNEEVAQATGLSMKRLTAVLLTPKAPRSLNQKPRSRFDRRYLAEGVHEEGSGEGVGQFESKREAGDLMEVWNGRRQDENVARNRGVDGCKQGKNPANRVVHLPEVEEQKENKTSAAIFVIICIIVGVLESNGFVYKILHFLSISQRVIMDVVNVKQARIAEEAKTCAIMALERVPADI